MRGHQGDGERQAQAGLGEQWGVHVGQHLGHDDPGPPLAECLGGVHEVAGDEPECDTAGDPGGPGSIGEPDEDDQHPRPGLGDGGQHDQRQQDLREGQHHVVEAHDDLVPPSATVGRDHADECPEDRAEHGGEQSDHQDLGAAVHQPGEDVLAQVVGAENALGAVRRADDLVLAVRGQQRAQQGEEGHQNRDDPAGHEPLLPQRLLPRRACGRGRGGGGAGCCRGAHEEIAVLARGVSRIESRSATRFTTTYTPAMIKVSACTIGTS